MMENNEKALMHERLERIEKGVEEIKLLITRLSKHNPEQLLEEEGLLSVKQAAKVLNIEVSAVYNKCASGNLPNIRIGKYYKFKRSELLSWVRMQNELGSINVDDYVNQYLQKNTLRG